MNTPDGRSEVEPSDRELATRVQRGESEAFELLARRFLRPTYAVVSSFLSGVEDIDDAVQETFLRALERIRTYNPRRPFAPWLYQVARNVARNRWKYIKQRHHETLDQVNGQSERDDPAKLTELSELRARVAEAIESLPERQRTSFLLHDVEGYNTTAIAEMLGVNDSTVRANLHHARKGLRVLLQPYKIDQDSQ